MAQEEETHKFRTAGAGDGGAGYCHGGGNPSIRSTAKKQKQKKVPQRGLGVAQLEKIRLQEQQNKDGSFIISSPPPPPRPSKFSDHRSSISLPIPKPASEISSSSSPDSTLKPQTFDFLKPNCASTVEFTNSASWRSVGVHHRNQDNLQKILNNYSDQYNLNYGFDHFFRSSLNFQFESNNPIWHLQRLMQSATPYQPPPATTELPSNQNINVNYYKLAEEDKMVSMKRAYSFSHSNFPTIIHSIGKSDESSSLGNSRTNPNFREKISCCDPIAEGNADFKKRSIKENGDFLTLAPPNSTTFKRVKAFQKDTFDFDSLPYQGSMGDLEAEAGVSVPNQMMQTYWDFLPPPITQIGQQTKKVDSLHNGVEVGEKVDLNLKL